MSVNLSPVAGAAAQFLDNSGNVLTGGKLFTYLAGTTTPAATYTSSTGVTFHANPIILDAAGRVPSGGEIWLSDNIQYKFVLKDANDVLIATWDNLSGINSNFVNYTVQEEIQTATAGQTVFTLTTLNYAPGTNSLTVYVDGVNQYEGGSYSFIETNSTTVTFTAGLHVGALVKFTTAVPATGTATNANVVTYEPAGTGAVTTTVQAKLRETVSVKDFGAVGDGVANDAPAVQTAVNSGAKNIYFPEGTYLFNSNSVATGEGACVILTSSHDNVNFIGKNATIKSATNKLQLFCINGADNVTFDGFVFDNSANGLLQNQVKPAGYGIPNGGIAGNGNSANAAIPLFLGSGLSVTNCEFLEFVFAIYYIHDYTDDQILGGHLYSSNNAFYGCVQGHLIDTPESYEINSCRAYDNEDSVNSDASIDPGHLIYVTNRAGAVPENAVITNIFDTNGKSSAIKVRKGRSIAISNFVCFQSSRGMEIWNVQEGSVTNCSITLATVGVTTNNSAVQITDCGGLRMSNLFLDIRNVDAWGFRILADFSPLYGNKNWSIADVTVLADYSTFVGKAAINITDQTQYLIDNPRWVVEGATPNTRRFINIDDSDYGIIRNPTATFENTAASVGYVTLGAATADNTVTMNLYDMPVFSAGSVFADGGANNIISSYSLGSGSSSLPSLSFLVEPTTGLYRFSSGIMGVTVNGTPSVGFTAADFRPLVDNARSLGVAASRWSVVYAATGTINTSDNNQKQQIKELSVKEKAVALKCKSLIRSFKFNNSVAEKGELARIHFGVIAQDVFAAFASEGLDANQYGLFCSDVLDDGSVQLGIRYEELFAFVLGAM